MDDADGDSRGRQHAEQDGGSAATSDATLAAGDVVAHALWIGYDIEGSGRIEALTYQGIVVAHWVLPVLSTVSAARRVPRALWRAFFTALSPIPSASPIELIG